MSLKGICLLFLVAIGKQTQDILCVVIYGCDALKTLPCPTLVIYFGLRNKLDRVVYMKILVKYGN